MISKSVKVSQKRIAITDFNDTFTSRVSFTSGSKHQLSIDFLLGCLEQQILQLLKREKNKTMFAEKRNWF
jgi:hypothetical protein